MTRSKPVVVLTRKLPESVETRMCELFDTRLNYEDTPMSSNQIIEAIQEADVLVPTITDRIDQSIINSAGNRLKLIANFGNGVDNIDVEAASQKGLTVTNTPKGLAEDTADMTMALILSVPRRLHEGIKAVNSGEWQGWSPNWMLGHRINGKRIGIIGLGRVGQAVARRAKAFGMQIHYHNRKRLHEDIEEEFEATYWESLDRMLTRMDVISVHCPHTPATFHLLSKRRLQLMKKDAFIVNTARGEVIDENALVDMLHNDQLAGAGLDVFEHAPNINPKLIESPHVVLLPHMGSATIEGRQEMGEQVIINIKSFIDGHRPPDKVILSRL